MVLCTKCNLIEGNKHNGYHYGNPNAEFLIIRNYPTMSECNGTNFKDNQQNDFLINYLKNYGFTEKDYFIINVINCYPRYAIRKENVLACRDNFKYQYNKTKPKLILGFGKLVLSTFIPELMNKPMGLIVNKSYNIGDVNYIPNFSIGTIMKNENVMFESNNIMDMVLNKYRVLININK